METIKYTIGLVFQLFFGVAAIGTYFNMLQLPRLEAESKSFVQLVHFIISMGLSPVMVMVFVICLLKTVYIENCRPTPASLPR